MLRFILFTILGILVFRILFRVIRAVYEAFSDETEQPPVKQPRGRQREKIPYNDVHDAKFTDVKSPSADSKKE